VDPLIDTPGALVVGRSPIHGRGLFARVSIPAGTLLGEYAGRRGEWSPQAFVGNWTMRVGDQLRNARLGGNLLRFVNHAKPPNVETIGFNFYAARDVGPGEEITMDYGHGWE
jgi:SET domain-containing protein